jgi:peptidylprolyl isomerase
VPTDKRLRQKQGQHARREAARAELRRQQRKRKYVTFAVLAVAVIGLVGLLSLLGGDDDKKSDAKATGAQTTTTFKTPPTSAKPADPEPGGSAPVTELKIEDIKVGSGKTVKAGDTIVAHYLGATYADGKPFQASWDSKQTFETVIGKGQVIEGWDKGIPGMKVGGRRKLIIPAAMAYGAADTGDGRPHGDLVFIIDVYAIK